MKKISSAKVLHGIIKDRGPGVECNTADITPTRTAESRKFVIDRRQLLLFLKKRYKVKDDASHLKVVSRSILDGYMKSTHSWQSV